MAKEYTWTQVEPALAILCSCLVTFGPLFNNLNLNIFKYTSRLSRSKSLSSSSQATNSTDMSKERRSHSPWPGTRDFHRQESTRLSSKGVSAKGGPHIVNIDLGTTDRKAPYKEILNSESRDGRDIWSQSKYSASSMTEGQDPVAGDV